MNKAEENYIDHEVRVRVLEGTTKEIKDTLIRLEDKMDNTFKYLSGKMDSHFKWILATILTLFGGIILHIAKLI